MLNDEWLTTRARIAWKLFKINFKIKQVYLKDFGYNLLNFPSQDGFNKSTLCMEIIQYLTQKLLVQTRI